MDKKIRVALRAYSQNQNDNEAAHRIAKELLRSQFNNLPIENVLEVNLHHLPQAEIQEYEVAVSEEMHWEHIQWFWNTNACPDWPMMDSDGNELGTSALPTLNALCTFAKSQGCKYILFSENGPILDGWSVYDRARPSAEENDEDGNLDNLLEGHVYE